MPANRPRSKVAASSFPDISASACKKSIRWTIRYRYKNGCAQSRGHRLAGPLTVRFVDRRDLYNIHVLGRTMLPGGMPPTLCACWNSWRDSRDPCRKRHDAAFRARPATRFQGPSSVIGPSIGTPSFFAVQVGDTSSQQGFGGAISILRRRIQDRRASRCSSRCNSHSR